MYTLKLTRAFIRMTPHPTDPIAGIRARLASARRRLAAGDLLTGGLWTVGLLASGWIAAAGLESVAWLDAGLRTGLLALVLLVAAASFTRTVAWPFARWYGLYRRIPDDTVADRVGRAIPDVRDRLLNLLQLLDGRHSAAPAPLVRTAADRLGRQIERADLDAVEDFSRVRRAGRLASLPVVGLVAFVLIAPDAFWGATGRLLQPTREFSRPDPFTIAVTPGDVDIVKGADLTVDVRLAGSGLPDGIALESRYRDESAVERVDLPVSGGHGSHTLVNVRGTLLYRAVAGELTTPWFTATVVDRPVVGGLQIVLRPPAYTRMPARALAPNDGDITALKGTEVLIEAVLSGPPIAEASAVFGGQATVPLSLDGRRATGSFPVLRDTGWHLEAVSTDGVPSTDPVQYSVQVIPDAAPSIAITSPETEFDLDESATVPLGWRIADDFGFSDLELHVRLESSRFGTPAESFTTLPLPLQETSITQQDGVLDWHLTRDTGLEPAPGDVFVYYLEVTDNDAVSGPKRARTGEYRVRMPSLTERYEALDETQDAAEERLEEVLDEAERMREAFEDLQDQLRSKPEADWQDQRAAEQLQQRQETLERSVQEVAEQIESMTDEMERNDLVGEETLEMFRELQEVAEEINSPELMETLRQLQEAMQQMNLQQMQDAMEQFRFSEDQYRERLERTLELFRNLRVQQDLEEAARRAEDLARTEEEIAERTEELERESEERETDPSDRNPDGQRPDDENAPGNDRNREDGDTPSESDQTDGTPEHERLAEEQERAASEMEALERKLQELRERMEELRQAPKSEMDQLSRDTESQQLPQQMRQNAEQLQNQQFSPAQQGQQQMSQQLQNLQQQLQQMLAGMQGSQQQMNLSGLRRALDDVLALSADQEALRGEVQTLASDSPQLRDSAQRQMRLSEGLVTVSDSLQALARQIPQMDRAVQAHAGDAQREMADATTAMTDRVARRAVGYQKGAMTHLNELALLLTDLMDQMMGGGGGSGSMSMQQMLQQLQNMAGQQQMLNEQIQQLLNDMAGNRMSSDAVERLRQLSDQQRQIREQLRELSRNRELRNQALGDLERIAEQMQETIEELELRQLTPETVMRQRQILTRLLEASRSLQERGRDRRRESRTGEDFAREGPGALTPSQQADQLRRDLIRALESGYAPDFQELIRRYFDLLQQEATDPAPVPDESVPNDSGR